MNIVFIRHGDPNYELDTLTPKGVREANALKFRVDKISEENADFFVSPLGRARKTAELALAGRNVKVTEYDWLQEFYYQITDPQTGKKRIAWDFLPEYWTQFPQYYDKDNWFKSEMFENTPIPEKAKWVTEEFDKLLETYGYFRDEHFYRAKPGSDRTLVFFCHLGVQFVLLGHMCGISPMMMWHQFFVAPTSVTVLNSEERAGGIASFRIRTMGDTSHLDAAGEPVSDSGLFPRKSFIF